MIKAFFLTFFLFCACFAPQYVYASGNFAGAVTDSQTGLPISGALIVATKGNQERQTTTTDMNGVWTMANLNQANFTIIASEPGYQTQSVGARLINNETTVVNFALVPTGGTISGTVTDAITTFPINGAIVEIFDGQTLIATETTDISGNYSAPNLAPGIYNINVSSPTFQTQSQGAAVLAGMDTVVDFALISTPAPGMISGTVTDTAIPTPNPIPDAFVEVFNGSILLGFANTDVNGNYTIPSLAPGSYTVTTSAEGFQSQNVGAAVSSGNTTTVDFALEILPGILAGTVTDASTSNPIQGASITVFQNNVFVASVLTDPNGQYNLSVFATGDYVVNANAATFQLQVKGASITVGQTTLVDFSLSPIPNPGIISGQVVTDTVTPSPIPGASVNVYNGQILIASAITDPDGNYQIPNLFPGNFIVIASKTDFETKAVGAIVTAGTTTTVNFALVSAFPPAGIAGTVTDGVNPIAGANVKVFSGQTLIGAGVTDINGSYAISDLAPGQYTVVASADNFETAFKTATVVANTTTTVNFVLQAIPDPGRKIAGTVTDASNGKPIPGTNISLYSNLTLIGSALANASGNYTIEGLAPGNYTVVANAKDFNISAVGADVTGSLTVVNFALTGNPGVIAGTVTTGATPLPGAAIEVHNDFVLIASAITDASGNYSIPNLEPDTYTASATASNFQNQTIITTVSSNKITVVDFSLISNPGSIFGTVTDGLNPIQNATVAAFQGTTLISFALTDVNGNYTIPDLAPGDYTVLAIAQGFRASSSAETLTAGATITADFVLDPSPQTIAGVVTDACTGLSVPGALILVMDGSEIVSFSVTNTNGIYSIDTFSPGSYTLIARKNGFITESSPATVFANITTIVSFSLTPTVSPAAGIFGCAEKNEFLTQTDLIHIISWTASPSSCVTGYQIFRNGTQIAFVPSTSKLEYKDHNRNKKTDIYSVQAVSSFGLIGDAVSVTINNQTKCP